MKSSAPGLWDIADAALCSIGRGAAWLVRRKIRCEEDYAAYAMTGGALLCAVFGAAAGYAVSDLSRSAAMEGTVIGGLLGACVGVLFGASVDAIDRTIQAMLRSLNSK